MDYLANPSTNQECSWATGCRMWALELCSGLIYRVTGKQLTHPHRRTLSGDPQRCPCGSLASACKDALLPSSLPSTRKHLSAHPSKRKQSPPVHEDRPHLSDHRDHHCPLNSRSSRHLHQTFAVKNQAMQQQEAGASAPPKAWTLSTRKRWHQPSTDLPTKHAAGAHGVPRVTADTGDLVWLKLVRSFVFGTQHKLGDAGRR